MEDTGEWLKVIVGNVKAKGDGQHTAYRSNVSFSVRPNEGRTVPVGRKVTFRVVLE